MPDIGGIAGERLRSFIERIERLEEEKRALSGDIKEVFAEAKGNGFDTKIMRQLIRIRRMDKDDLDEQAGTQMASRVHPTDLPAYSGSARYTVPEPGAGDE